MPSDTDSNPLSKGSVAFPLPLTRPEWMQRPDHLVVLIPLHNNQFALARRDFVVDSIIDSDDLTDSLIHQLADRFEVELGAKRKLTAEARFLGEPDDHSFAKSLRAERRPASTARGASKVVDIEL